MKLHFNRPSRRLSRIMNTRTFQTKWSKLHWTIDFVRFSTFWIFNVSWHVFCTTSQDSNLILKLLNYVWPFPSKTFYILYCSSSNLCSCLKCLPRPYSIPVYQSFLPATSVVDVFYPLEVLYPIFCVLSMYFHRHAVYSTPLRNILKTKNVSRQKVYAATMGRREQGQVATVDPDRKIVDHTSVLPD